MGIVYRNDARPDAEEIVQLHTAAELRRPRQPERVIRMYTASPLVWTAHDDERLVGVLRGWTDGAFDGYVCDLAVHPDYQRRGVGRELLSRCIGQHPHEVQWVLRASVIAAQYYAHLGWQKIENGWCWPRAD
jgi:GNAT superfamily N-acetyltransferase